MMHIAELYAKAVGAERHPHQKENEQQRKPRTVAQLPYQHTGDKEKRTEKKYVPATYYRHANSMKFTAKIYKGLHFRKKYVKILATTSGFV
jgi:hypothetical protein